MLELAGTSELGLLAGVDDARGVGRVYDGALTSFELAGTAEEGEENEDGMRGGGRYTGEEEAMTAGVVSCFGGAGP